MTVVIVTEKPAVARDIAAVLGLTRKGQGYIEGPNYQVTWAFGHLVGLAEPHQINPNWKAWRANDLPMLPEQWPLEIMESTANQFDTVKRLITAAATDSVICATDAGREGELIFRYIYEKAGCRKPVQRLWISSLTMEAIKQGLSALRPGAEFDGLADSARARSRADWLVGMNLSRAYSIQSGENFSIGRVQTPTLAMVVERDIAIKNFIVEDYVVIQAIFTQELSTNYRAELQHSSDAATSKPDAKSATLGQALRFDPLDPRIQLICKRLVHAEHEVDSLKEKPGRIPPPQFYDLTELQRHANRIYGFSAQKTLDLAQDLYEKHKAITYPRTDSRYISEDIAAELDAIVERLKQRYQELTLGAKFAKKLSSRFVDKTRITDHHAILPTNKALALASLSADHRDLYDMICRRLLTAFMEDLTSRATEAVIRSTSLANKLKIYDQFLVKGRRVLQLGWKRLDFAKDSSSSGDKELPAAMTVGAKQDLVKVEASPRKTIPPAAINDASLLTAMEHAGAHVIDKKLAAAMREHGLGTPATRSSIIETLIKRLYIQREQRSLRATEKGFRLIEQVAEEVKSPQLTGDWELRLSQIRSGKGSLLEFTEDIKAFVSRMTEVAFQSQNVGDSRQRNQAGDRKNILQETEAKPFVEPVNSLASRSREPAKPKKSSTSKRQAAALDKSEPVWAIEPEEKKRLVQGGVREQDLLKLLQQRFGFNVFRSHQESTCRDLVEHRDVLLVMPTGAGKSLCYQLPGLALGGPTLVISPLIALMDDQVAKLKSMGMTAAAIHSGNSRTESQEICRLYASAQLEFLFVAPERLAVQGFVAFLTKFKPQLIAIDEAHCISNWGHDFRYDYRRLTERLAPLRPAVVIAMTATATLRVQQDIVQQLDLQNLVRHVHGFRRTNIAIENIAMPKPERPQALVEILKLANSLPAIVYAPTRKEAEQIAAILAKSFRAAAYHAGIDVDRRSRVQAAFQVDKLEVIVATVAFGMGIDKPNVRTVIHMAAPGSIEGYYQEIGRAGRDGRAARAVLLYSYADWKTHEYFHKLNYPDVLELKSILGHLSKTGVAKALMKAAQGDIDHHIDRLIMIGAVEEDADGILRATGQIDWQARYSEQKEHRHAQLTEMNRYVNALDGCRMLRLMEHFGDIDAQGAACGLCDLCLPPAHLERNMRRWSPEEVEFGKVLVDGVAAAHQPIALGKLFREYAENLGMSRRDFESLVGVLIQNKYLNAKEESFTKAGEVIHYRTVHCGQTIPRVDWQLLELPVVKNRPKAVTKKAKSLRKGATRAKQKSNQSAPAPADSILLEKLEKWRRVEAKQRKIPPYCILSNKSLLALANEKPKDLVSLLAIHGIGETKVEQYGGALLNMIRV